MKNIQNISFPRSGHHLLVNCLTKYYSDNLYFAQSSGSYKNDEIIKAGKLHYCEFYNHCRQIPCVVKTVNFQKNHDLGLFQPKLQQEYTLNHTLLKPDNRKTYIIQFRENPYNSIISEYLRNIKTYSFTKRNIKEDYNYFLKFSLDYLDYWKAFNQKWILNPPKNSLIISYESFLKAPEFVLKNVLLFMGVKSPDLEKIKAIITYLNICEKNKISDFKYYEPFLENINSNYKVFINHQINELPENQKKHFVFPNSSELELENHANKYLESESNKLIESDSSLLDNIYEDLDRLKLSEKVFKVKKRRIKSLIDFSEKLQFSFNKRSLQDEVAKLEITKNHNNLKSKIEENYRKIDEIQTQIKDNSFSNSSSLTDNETITTQLNKLIERYEQEIFQLVEEAKRISEQLSNLYNQNK